MNRNYHWGIMGAGIIARKMADALHATDGTTLLSVGSKDRERARMFAEEMNVPRHGTYDELLGDPDVDIVYVATTHNFHYENAIAVLECGKHLLVEKPFTVNTGETDAIMKLARTKGLFVMEALWTRFLPSWVGMREMIVSGELGDIGLVDVTFGKFIPPQFERRLNDPLLAGGATLDLGVYPLSFCSYILGEIPGTARSTARLTEQKIDDLATYQVTYPSGTLAQIATSFNLAMSDRATIYGTRAQIEFSDFPAGNSFRLFRHDGTNEIVAESEITFDHYENGFRYQVEEVISCISTGETESKHMPHDETRAIIALMDSMRHDWGVRYSNDQ